MLALQSVAIAVPIAVLSFSELGEKIIAVSLVVAAVTIIWRQAVKPIVTGSKRMVDTYELAVEHLPGLVRDVSSIKSELDELKRAGELIDISRDDHAQAARRALDRYASERPQ